MKKSDNCCILRTKRISAAFSWERTFLYFKCIDRAASIFHHLLGTQLRSIYSELKTFSFHPNLNKSSTIYLLKLSELRRSEWRRKAIERTRIKKSGADLIRKQATWNEVVQRKQFTTFDVYVYLGYACSSIYCLDSRRDSKWGFPQHHHGKFRKQYKCTNQISGFENQTRMQKAPKSCDSNRTNWLKKRPNQVDEKKLVHQIPIQFYLFSGFKLVIENNFFRFKKFQFSIKFEYLFW